MSVPRFDRDLEEERPRGRVVPMEQTTLIDIRVNGVAFGTIDPSRLKARAQIDLERSRGALDLLRWCRDHGGVSDQRGPNGEPSELEQLEDELGDMPLQAIMDLIVSISEALGASVEIPKVRPRR